MLIPKKLKAAVLREIKKPLELQELNIPKVEKKQCLVKIMYSSVCKSQLMEINGGRGKDKYLPHLLGHEASGVIISKHHSVKKFSVGDEVILSWIKNKKLKTQNIIYSNNKGQKINSGPITTFGNYSIVYENCIYKKPKFLDFKLSALLGCAIPTGYGLVDNEIKSLKNKTVAVIGAGGIGLSALLALSNYNPKKIYVIDKNKRNLERINFIAHKKIFFKSRKKTIEEVLNHEKKGVDYCFESAGSTETIEMGFDLIAKGGGKLVFASHPHDGKKIKLPPHDLISGKKIKGSWAGGYGQKKSFLEIAPKIKNKINLLNSIFVKQYDLKDINKLVRDFSKGKIFKPIIKMKH